jgi:hypothetical protein
MVQVLSIEEMGAYVKLVRGDGDVAADCSSNMTVSRE